MAVFTLTQDKGLPLLSEVMQIDWQNRKEVLEFITVKTGLPRFEEDEFADWGIFCSYANPHQLEFRTLTRKFESGEDETVLHYYPSLDFNPGAIRSISKLIELTQKVVTDVFEKGTIEHRFILAIREWGTYVEHLSDGLNGVSILDSAEYFTQMPFDPNHAFPIENVFKANTNNTAAMISPLIRDIYLTLISIYGEKQYQNLRKCPQCGNIYLSNPIKQKTQQYCSRRCGNKVRLSKFRQKSKESPKPLVTVSR